MAVKIQDIIEDINQSMKTYSKNGYISCLYDDICISDYIDCEFIKRISYRMDGFIKKYYKYEDLYFSIELYSNSWGDNFPEYRIFDIIKTIKEEKFIKMVPLFESEV